MIISQDMYHQYTKIAHFCYYDMESENSHIYNERWAFITSNIFLTKPIIGLRAKSISMCRSKFVLHILRNTISSIYNL